MSGSWVQWLTLLMPVMVWLLGVIVKNQTEAKKTRENQHATNVKRLTDIDNKLAVINGTVKSNTERITDVEDTIGGIRDRVNEHEWWIKRQTK